MSHAFVVARLDLPAFAGVEGVLSGQYPLSRFPRLLEETGGQGAERPVHWEARGESRTDASGSSQVWLHLAAQVGLPLTCQRCLGPADIPLVVDRSFRFVPTEEQAAAEDDASDEDVLVLSRDFNLLELIEDELLMVVPLVPRHEVCPTAVKLAVQDPGFEAAEAAKPNPFAALAGLRGGKSG